ncbi:RNA helicase Mov10l1 [Lingula anatina]|uniref:RNA helicase n=1 Tax=Lingula anatina TaxID=7574 RepID=A0A1S3HIP4_LINAN|nr:RNA helicase Mov10l1 [Lingula anatina]|eukprot:XP_013385978.1 RNA helicase Mov10l1 [Lingula anatina]
MLSALSKVVSYFFYEEDGEDSREEAPSSPHFDISGNPDTQTESSVDSGLSQTSRTIDGTVTSLHNGYGLVDNEIYFTFDSVIGGCRPALGAHVHVQAVRQKQHGGWQAQRVVIEDSSWDGGQKLHNNNYNPIISQDDPEQVAIRDTQVAMVTSIKGDLGLLNDEVSFSVQSAALHGFAPYRGDWVVAQTTTNTETGYCTAESISPLREQDFSGEINAVLHGYGFIDEEIYFPLSACVQGYQPRRGDRVKGVMLESRQGKCSWRARTVLPSIGVGESDKSSKTVLESPFPVINGPSSGGFLKKLLQDKGGITISQKTNFGKMELGELKSLVLWIRNTNSNETRTLKSCRFKTHPAALQFAVTVQQQTPQKGDVAGEGQALLPGTTVFVTVECKGMHLGQDKQLLIFDFDGYTIGRYMSVDVQDPQQTSLDPSAPYNRKRNYGKYKAASQRNGSESWVLPGQRPQRMKSVPFPARLPQFEIPRELKNCIFEKRELVNLAPELGEPLSMQNYTTRFSTLLHLEEIQMEIEIRDYDLESVTLRRVGEYLALAVPGLAEGRPSVAIGDKVVLSHPGDMEVGPQYEGYVHVVLSEEVLLKFHNSFHQNYYAEEYDVMFTINRTQLRRCHQAVRFSKHLGTKVLFPVQLHPKMPVPSKSSAKVTGAKSSQHFFNTVLNCHQRAAVSRILEGQSRPSPYVLFGPPGTGKTVTMVEAILQVLHTIPGSRILACAPSNSATDLLAEKLLQSNLVNKSDLVRLNAFNRLDDNIPEFLKPYCTTGDNLEVACRHRVVLCTCITAGLLNTVGLKSGHFTHAFIDEAGQATEPDCAVPMNLMVGEDSQIVLAGDPMQLGPVLKSRHAITYGLQYSFLERLMDSPLYARDMVRFADHGNYDPLLVTKLIHNYRSHSKLLQLPSELFYHGELRECGSTSVTHCMCGWDRLPNKDVPIIFHGLRGEDLREGNSPSWFNPVEAVQVMKYLQALVNNPRCAITFDDIGIITPYRKQVEKIRLLIDKLGMEKVKVGSVEEFQGQERRVIIISTVRSNESQMSFDRRFNLGFLSNPKRFNVAITRAQSLLIVCGNPHVLAQDEHWLSLLSYCVEHGAYVGCNLPDLPQLQSRVTVESNTNECQASDVLLDRDTEQTSSNENLNKTQQKSSTEVGNKACGELNEHSVTEPKLIYVTAKTANVTVNPDPDKEKTSKDLLQEKEVAVDSEGDLGVSDKKQNTNSSDQIDLASKVHKSREAPQVVYMTFEEIGNSLSDSGEVDSDLDVIIESSSEEEIEE